MGTDAVLKTAWTKTGNEAPSGVKYDAEKPDMSLLPVKAIEAEAQVWTFGKRKYNAWNWTKGITISRILAAILRHTFAILRGEDYDPESKLPHAAHIRCGAAMLIEFLDRPDLDDRYKGATHGTTNDKV